MVDKKSTIGDKIKALPGIAMFYSWWYPTRWLKGLFTPSYISYGRFASHLRFIHRSAAKCARESFHGMLLFREGMERKQLFLFRLVDVVNELFAMTASIARAIAMEKRNAPEAAMAADAADMFCKGSRRVVQDRFNALWSNDDDAKVAFSRTVLKGDHVWMEKMVTDLIDAQDKNENASAAK
jgi:hypothetical protein